MEKEIRETIEDFANDYSKNVLWIYGRTGCGKTKSADFLIRKVKDENKKVCPLNAEEFLGMMLELIIGHRPLTSLISYCQDYDLLVLDNMDIKFDGKPKTQEEIKNIILKIIENRKTKVVLISEKRPKKLRNLKFDTKNCYYLGLKVPNDGFKINLLRNWAKKKDILIPEGIVANIARNSRNLFQLKGLFNKFCFKY